MREMRRKRKEREKRERGERERERERETGKRSNRDQGHNRQNRHQ